MTKTRQDIIRECILGFDADIELLEIGVEYGDTWHYQRGFVKNYTGVDPDLSRCRASIPQNDPRCHWFEMNSREFWGMIELQPFPYLCSVEKTWNVIFIDGDHRYETAKNDIQNALKHLESRGYVILHDAVSGEVFQAYQEVCLPQADLTCVYYGPEIERHGMAVCRRKT